MSRRSRLTVPVLALAIAACAGKAPVATPHAGASPAAGAASARPTAAPTARASGSAATPAAAVKAPVLLKAPEGDSVTFSGTVTLDAAYVVASGGGNVIASGGGNVIAAGGGNLLHQDGAGVISQGGGNVVSQGAGNVIASGGGNVIASGGGNVVVPAELLGQDGASLIHQDGASLIGSDAAGLIGHDGASLIGHDGASLIGHDGASYRLLEAMTPQLLPAAGMWVSVVDTRSGKPLSLGKDDAGGDVYTIYSDAQGGFTVHLPKDLAKNVRVVARAPGMKDPRLTLNVITPVAAGSHPIDHTHAAATAFLRNVMAQKLYRLAEETPEQVAQDLAGTESDLASLAALVQKPLAQLKQVYQENGGQALAADKRLALALVATDVMLADMDLEGVKTQFLLPPVDPANAKYAGEGALAALQDTLDQVDAAVRQVQASQADPAAYFAAKPYVRVADTRRSDGGSYKVEQAGDFNDMLVFGYLIYNDHHYFTAADRIFADLGLDPALGDRLRGGGFSLFVQILLRYTAAPDDPSAPSVADLADAAMRAAAPSIVARPEPAAVAATPVPTPRPPDVTVSTVAGATGGGYLDGAKALFQRPTSIAAAPDNAAGHETYYVTDASNAAIRRLRPGADGSWTVDTVFKGGPGYADGDAKTARLDTPWGIAVAPDGKTLYVSDHADAAVRQLALAADGGVTVTTLARGKPLVAPTGLALDAQGHLWVADTEANRVFELADPSHPVLTPVIGRESNPSKTDVDGKDAADVQLWGPDGLAFGPDGTLYVAESTTSAVRSFAGPVGPTSATRFIAGGGPDPLNVDGVWANALLGHPTCLVFDARSGGLVMVERDFNRVRLVSLDDVVSPLAGRGNDLDVQAGYADGSGEAARFNAPTGAALRPDGSLLVVDSFNHLIRLVTR